MSSGVWRRLLENWKRTVCATRATEIKLPLVTIKPPSRLRQNSSMFVATPWIPSRCPASRVRLASSRSRKVVERAVSDLAGTAVGVRGYSNSVIFIAAHTATIQACSLRTPIGNRRAFLKLEAATAQAPAMLNSARRCYTSPPRGRLVTWSGQRRQVGRSGLLTHRVSRRCASDASYESVGNAGSINVTTNDISPLIDSVKRCKG